MVNVILAALAAIDLVVDAVILWILLGPVREPEQTPAAQPTMMSEWLFGGDE